MKAIIAGGRDYKPTTEDIDIICDLINQYEIDTIIQGGANGADSFGLWVAETFNINHIDFPAKWDDIETNDPLIIATNKQGKKYNKLAGHNRNERMAKEADICILFPGGSGTLDMNKRAVRHNLRVIHIQTLKDQK